MKHTTAATNKYVINQQKQIPKLGDILDAIPKLTPNFLYSIKNVANKPPKVANVHSSSFIYVETPSISRINLIFGTHTVQLTDYYSMSTYSFLNDYSEGAHPSILQALLNHNLTQQNGYGNDAYSIEAKTLIKNQMNAPDAEITFVSGGTQANLIIISSALRPHESVISADTGHITHHEAGAIEATGHKVNTVLNQSGKLCITDLKQVMRDHDFGPHVVKPKMLYISNTTEIGSIYTKQELMDLYAYAQANNLYLFLDGARLGAALMTETNDLTLADIAKYTDVFTIGGTKNGALLGEAIVITNPELKTDFLFHIKQKGAMLSKGRLLGIQFKTLFTDNLYFDLATHANAMASKLAKAITACGYTFLTEPTSNLIFPILPNTLVDQLENAFVFYRWKEQDENLTVLRVVTSWATKEEEVDKFIRLLSEKG